MDHQHGFLKDSQEILVADSFLVFCRDVHNELLHDRHLFDLLGLVAGQRVANLRTAHLFTHSEELGGLSSPKRYFLQNGQIRRS